MNQYSEMVVDENDLVEGLLQRKSVNKVITKDVEKIDSYNHFCSLFKFNDVIDYETPADSSDKYSYKDAENWCMPDEYKQLNIIDYLLSKTQNEEQYQRVVSELEEFEKREMFPMLKFLVYMVNELNNNKKDKCNMCKINFRYNSNDNKKQLNISDLKKVLQKNFTRDKY